MAEKTRARLTLIRGGPDELNRSASDVEFVTNFQGTAGDGLQFVGTPPRHDIAPLADCGGADTERPRDIRGALKVIDNVFLQHAPSVTGVKSQMQPPLYAPGLTSVHMNRHPPTDTLAARLIEAMRARSAETGVEITASDLARACGVSPAAVSKWLDGQTKQLKAQNYVDAARALGVREEWLRTGRLPKERAHAEDERRIDQVIEILGRLRGPLSDLLSAIDELSRPEQPPRKRQRG